MMYMTNQNVALKKECKKLYLTEEEYEVDKIYNNTLDTLQEATQAWKLVDKLQKKYMEVVVSLTTTGAVRYDNPLGCKIQSSNHVTMDERVINMIELEERCTEATKYYREARERVRQLILNSNLTETERRVMIAKYLNDDYPSYSEVARRANVSGSTAFNAHRKAFVKIADNLERSRNIEI